MNTWPDGAMTPFRSEKNSNWEGAYRVPAMVRWPGKIKPGSVSNEIVAHLDWLPTLLAIAGDTQVKDKLLKGYKVGDMTYKVHLDGYNLVPYLTGQAAKSPRESFLYINDDQQLTGLRYDNWKLVFMEQRAPGTLRIWAEPFTSLRVPKIFNLRTDPYERADITSNTYYDWLLDHAFLLVPAQAYVGQFLMTFKDYPQRQKAASFNLDEVMQKLQESARRSRTDAADRYDLRPPRRNRRGLQRQRSHRSSDGTQPMKTQTRTGRSSGRDETYASCHAKHSPAASSWPAQRQSARRSSCLEDWPRQRTGRRPSPSCTPTTCTRAFIGHGPGRRTTPRSRSTTTRPGAGTRAWPRLIAKRKAARKDQGPVLVLDAGDYSMGTAFGAATRETGGELQLMSRMGYDATTFGNHEFDLGPDGLGKSIGVAAKAGRVPAVVASNTNFAANDATLADLQRLAKDGVIRRHLVIERGGIRFGIFGVLGKEAMFYTSGACG